MRLHRTLSLAALLAMAAWAADDAVGLNVALSVDPPQPTPSTGGTLNIEVTNDNLDPCDYEVRLFANYGGLTVFDREDDGGTIRLVGRLIPHLIAPVDVEPCAVPCIAVEQQPRATYADVPLDKLEPGSYHVEVFLPVICGLKTDCVAGGAVDCDFEEPLMLDFTVDEVAAVRARGRLAVRWAALKSRARGRR